MRVVFYSSCSNHFDPKIVHIKTLPSWAQEWGRVAATPAVNIDNSEGGSPCDGTNDKVFLLSKTELINNGYGFGTDPAPTVSDSTRQRAATDFALATGVSYEYVEYIACTGSSWWVCTSASGASVSSVVANGSPGWENYVNVEYNGVVPALCVNP